MNGYILILLWPLVLALISRFVYCKKTITVEGKSVERYNWIFVILAFIPLVILVATRSMYIGDTVTYKSQFERIPTIYEEFVPYLSKVEKDKAFTILIYILKTIFIKDYLTFFYVIAIIQSYFLAVVFRKYSDEFVFTFFLFIASGDYISWMCNGIRQFIAVTIIFCATPLFLKRKYFWSIVVIAIASLFHMTALLMIPLLFVCLGKPWNKKTLIFIVLVVLAILFVGTFTNILSDVTEGTSYNQSLDYYTSHGDTGTNILRVAFYSIPAVISLIKKKEIEERNDIVLDFCTNASIVSAGIYLVSAFTSGILIGRLPIYVSLYSHILMTNVLFTVFKKETRTIYIAGTVILYLAFYYYELYTFKLL